MGTAKLPTCENSQGLFFSLQSTTIQASVDVIEGARLHLMWAAELGGMVHVVLALASRKVP